MKFHQYAEIFPLLEGDELDSLAADIKSNGMRQIITLYQGKILDGRNRFLACQKVRVKPHYHKFHGDNNAALKFVVSANMHRRHLTESQRAMAAARIATLKHGQRADLVEGVPIGTSSEIVGASERSTKRAKKVISEGSKALQSAVDAGQVSVSRAAAVTDLPKRDQLAAAKEKPAKPDPDLDAWEPEEDEEEQLAQAEKEYAASVDKVMAADDKLAAAHVEIKRQAAEIASLKLSRNQYQTRCDVLIRKVKSLQRQNKKLQRA